MTDTMSGNLNATPYPVEVIRSARRQKTVSARVVDGRIRVRIPAWMSSEDERRFVADVVERIEQKRRSATVDLDVRARQLAEQFELPEPASIRWATNQQHRWGSCSVGSGDIRISTRLVDVPPWVLDHVIVHELVHLVVADHSDDFHRLLARYPLAERATGYLLALSDQPARTASEATPARPRRAG